MNTKLRTSLVVLALLFLLTANLSLWMNDMIFDRGNFAATTVDTLHQPKVRDALSAEIVGTVLGNFPTVQGLIGEPLQSVIGGLIVSKRFEPVLARLAEGFNVMMTSPQSQEVAVDISAIKGFVGPIVETLDSRFEKQIKTSDIPNSIVLVKKGEIPSIYSWAIVLLTLGPILGLLGIGILAGLVWRTGVDERPHVLKLSGGILAGGSIVFMLLIRTSKSPILASVQGSNVKIIAGSLFDAFTGSLISQTWLLVLAGSAMIGAGYFLRSKWMPGEQRPPQELKKAA